MSLRIVLPQLLLLVLGSYGYSTTNQLPMYGGVQGNTANIRGGRRLQEVDAVSADTSADMVGIFSQLEELVVALDLEGSIDVSNEDMEKMVGESLIDVSHNLVTSGDYIRALEDAIVKQTDAETDIAQALLLFDKLALELDALFDEKALELVELSINDSQNAMESLTEKLEIFMRTAKKMAENHRANMHDIHTEGTEMLELVAATFTDEFVNRVKQYTAEEIKLVVGGFKDMQDLATDRFEGREEDRVNQLESLLEFEDSLAANRSEIQELQIKQINFLQVKSEMMESNAEKTKTIVENNAVEPLVFTLPTMPDTSQYNAYDPNNPYAAPYNPYAAPYDPYAAYYY